MKIQQAPLTEEIKNIINKGFKEHAIETIGRNELDPPICFYFTDTKNKIIAAVVTQNFWGALHIKNVWVHKERRSHGYGRTLMNEALKYAKEKGYKFAFVETMSFQAPEFYQKLGFKLELKRDGYSLDTSFCYFKKDL